jgi:PAS domain S-box-containing protein
MICKIIIADTDESHAGSLAAYLDRLDYITAVAVTIEQLQLLLTEHLPDIVMLDSGLFGSGLNKELRAIKKHYPLTWSIVLAPAETMDQLKADLIGSAFGFVAKPVKSMDLDHTLHQARQAIRLQRQLSQCQQEIQELRTTPKPYRQLFREMPCYLTVQDRNLQITASNRLFKEHFGDEIGAKCYKIYKHRDSPCPECPVEKTFHDGKAHQTEEVVTDRTGTQYNILTWTAPIRDPSGQITQVIEMATDITQIRKLQDHLTSLGLMLGSISHGVKGMLTALDGAVYQLESGVKQQDMPRITAGAGETREMVDRIRKMMLHILYYAKSRELNYETKAVSDLADEIMAVTRPLAEKYGVTLTLFMIRDLGTIEIDPQWLPAAIINVVENAIHACDDNDEPQPKEVEVRISPDSTDKGIVIRIQDSGKGIDKETMEKMFTLFFSRRGPHGTGLGLFIAHHVITTHRGSIRVDSTPGQGACFEIRLPRRPPFKPISISS